MENPTLLQFFHWYYPEGGKLWPEVAEKAEWLANTGITMVWLPPAYKGAEGAASVGYDTYDLFDLGEFDQKGSVATKYGDKAQLVAAVQKLRDHNVGVLLDVVLNHKMGADEKEQILVNRVNEDNRDEIDPEGVKAEAWTKFTFGARQGEYSKFVWNHQCFSGVDHIENPDENGVFKIVNEYTAEGWNTEVDDEFGNFDYLMGANIDFRNNAVREELHYWARWIMEQVPCTGFRLDAVKHIPAWFYKEWIDKLQEAAAEPMYLVAEYWTFELDRLQQYIHQVDGKTMLFDAPLLLNFHHASKQGKEFDLTKIFDNTLVQADPWHAVTIVANHDTQPLQSLEIPVEPWFKPLAYALILLREQGLPAVFYPDLFSAQYEDTGDDGEAHQIDLPAVDVLPALLKARQDYAWGIQTDYLDDANCIAFVRSGTAEKPGCVVVMSNGDEGFKDIILGDSFTGSVWKDITGNADYQVECNQEGSGHFGCKAGSVSVWIKE